MVEITEQKIINKEREDTVQGIQEKTEMFYIAALFVFIPLVMAIVIMLNHTIQCWFFYWLYGGLLLCV